MSKWGPWIGIILFLTSCADNPYAKGKLVYDKMCASCHMEDGSGLVGNIPSLNKAPIFGDIQKVVCIIRNGKAVDSTKALAMPQFDLLSDLELANLINYLGHTYGNDNQYMPSEINKMEANCEE